MKRFLSTFVIGALLLGGQDVATISVNVRLVRVACTATRANGQVVTGLTQKDFQLRDRGVPQEVRYFWREGDLPLTVGLVVDVSGSQMRNLANIAPPSASSSPRFCGPATAHFWSPSLPMSASCATLLTKPACWPTMSTTA